MYSSPISRFKKSPGSVFPEVFFLLLHTPSSLFFTRQLIIWLSTFPEFIRKKPPSTHFSSFKASEPGLLDRLEGWTCRESPIP